jgi:outer membrane protein TolC
MSFVGRNSCRPPERVVDAEHAENNVALKIREIYYGALIAQLKQGAAEQQRLGATSRETEAKSEIERGSALEVTALETRAAVLEAKQAVLTEHLDVHDLQLTLKDLLGLPLGSNLVLYDGDLALVAPIPALEQCIDQAKRDNPEIKAAQQSIVKAQAGLAAAKDAYIPDVTGLARYSYQSGLPFLVHNFGTFGFSMTYDLFDGGRRSASFHAAQIALDHHCRQMSYLSTPKQYIGEKTSTESQ